MAFNLDGNVQSGGTDRRHITELENASVQLFEATSGQPRLIGTAQTNRNGAFTILAPSEQSNSVFYVIARTREGAAMMTLIGPELPHDVTVNELTTVAAIWSTAQFFANDALSGDAFGLQIAAKMNANVASIASGELSDVLERSPNHDETNARRSMYALSNLLAACIRRSGSGCALMSLATLPGQAPPASTLAALHNIARHPAYNANQIYSNSRAEHVYEPTLEQPPDAWTIAVKVNDTGSKEHLFGGPGNIAFDAKGRAWITNNVVQGTPHSTEWAIVLDAAGHPATDSNGRLLSPFKGGGLLGGGFGVLVNPDGTVWMGNFGWGGDPWYPKPQGSVSLIAPDARPLSPDHTGFQSGTYRVQGMARDTAGNLWIASFGNRSVVVFLNGNPETAVAWQGPQPFMAFGVAIAADGTAWVTSSDPVGTVVQLQLANNQLTQLREVRIGSENKGILIDSAKNIWVASGGNGAVYILDENGALQREVKGVGGLDGPWGLCFDGDENVWAGDFGPLQKGSNFHGRVTHLAGIHSGLPLGDPLSPPSGYTVPSAGEEVLLNNGERLYGPTGPKCFIPMMRTTAVNVDAAGNVWTCNNWKPDFDIDHERGNPGGDGIMIFLGLAKPVNV